MLKIGIIGIGFVGNAIKTCLENKNIKVLCYDKYKKYDKFYNILISDIIFLALPTPYCEKNQCFDKSSIIDTCRMLSSFNYNGVVVIKSTVETHTTNILSNKFSSLQFIHNPEFLSAKTAIEDFENQTHIIIGKSYNINYKSLNKLYNFYTTYFPKSDISICSSEESETMKLFVNSFYSVKVQFFNELYDFSIKNKLDFEKIRELMLKNNWINPMHTQVPGPDGKLSYGGACLPKDSKALLSLMKSSNCHYYILQSSIKEQSIMRNNCFDEINFI